MHKITSILLSLATALPLALPVGAATYADPSGNDVTTQPEQVLAQRINREMRMNREQRRYRGQRRCRIVRQRVCRYSRYPRRGCRYVTRRVCRNWSY